MIGRNVSWTRSAVLVDDGGGGQKGRREAVVVSKDWRRDGEGG